MINKIAVIGADENVGREVLSVLAEKNFPAKEFAAITLNHDLEGKLVGFGMENTLELECLCEYDFKGTDIVFSLLDDVITRDLIEKTEGTNCIIIDRSTIFKFDNDVPLVISEVNPYDVEKYKNKKIISLPNSLTTIMLTALKPLHDLAKIKRIVFSSYQAVSDIGKVAMDELYDHTKKIYSNEFLKPENFPKQITFNVIPQTSLPVENGNYEEEIEVVKEIRKILDEDIKVTGTCVMVPVFVGTAISVNIEFEDEIKVEEAIETLEESDSVVVKDRYEESVYATPKEVALEDSVFVSRIRKDLSCKNSLNLWLVADNIKKGLAINAVNIAEILAKKYI